MGAAPPTRALPRRRDISRRPGTPSICGCNGSSRAFRHQHWSALAYHGLTEQVPRAITASTPRDIVTPRMRDRSRDQQVPASTWDVDGLSVRYVRVSSDHFWGFDQIWVDEFSRVSIMDRERSVLDGFVSPSVFGSLHEILGVLEEHLQEIDIPRLVEYALRFGRAAVTKRLGYALEELGIAPDAVRPLREAPIRGIPAASRPEWPRSGLLRRVLAHP